MTNRDTRQKGFTLIETLFAVLILATAIAGPLTIASKGLTAALTAKDQTTAFYLAQDAIEFIRFARDTNIISGAPAGGWLTGEGASNPTDLSVCMGANGCKLDSLKQNPVNPTAYDTSAYQTDSLYFASTTGYFTYQTNGNTRTIFSRQIKITTPVGTNSDEAQIEVNVSWRGLSGKTNTITVREHLLNWQII